MLALYISKLFKYVKTNIDYLENRSVVVIGAGISGCTLALYLAKKGYKVQVYEKRMNLINNNEIKKRTVGMSISERGITTLKDLDLYDNYKSLLVPKYGRAVHLRSGQVYSQFYGANKEAIYTVNRKHFNFYLMDACLKTGNVEFFYGHKLDKINVENKEVIFATNNNFSIDGQDNSNSGEKVVQYEYLFGCDGTFSCVRQQLVDQGLVDAALSTLDYRFKEIYIPPRNGEYVLDPNYVHIWNIAELLFVALPDGKKGFNGTLFYTESSEVNKLKDNEKLFEFVQENCQFLSFIDKEQFIHEFNSNPESKISEVKCNNWNFQNQILLVGDAAHAMPPFYAMGMNTCIESVRVFAHLIDEFGGDIGKAISHFTERRIIDTEAMKAMANRNYKKLRKCHNKDFDEKWNQAHEAMKQSNGEYETEYFQVAFTNKPFSQIVEKYGQGVDVEENGLPVISH